MYWDCRMSIWTGSFHNCQTENVLRQRREVLSLWLELRGGVKRMGISHTARNNPWQWPIRGTSVGHFWGATEKFFFFSSLHTSRKDYLEQVFLDIQKNKYANVGLHIWHICIYKICVCVYVCVHLEIYVCHV